MKLLPTISYISIVVSARIGRFSQNGSHILFVVCGLWLHVMQVLCRWMSSEDNQDLNKGPKFF